MRLALLGLLFLASSVPYSAAGGTGQRSFEPGRPLPPVSVGGTPTPHAMPPSITPVVTSESSGAPMLFGGAPVVSGGATVTTGVANPILTSESLGAPVFGGQPLGVISSPGPVLSTGPIGSSAPAPSTTPIQNVLKATFLWARLFSLKACRITVKNCPAGLSGNMPRNTAEVDIMIAEIEMKLNLRKLKAIIHPGETKKPIVPGEPVIINPKVPTITADPGASDAGVMSSISADSDQSAGEAENEAAEEEEQDEEQDEETEAEADLDSVDDQSFDMQPKKLHPRLSKRFKALDDAIKQRNIHVNVNVMVQ
jgi:hypothetical protein